MSTEKPRTRPKTTLKLVLVEVGRGDGSMAASWEITPNIDTFVGDLNKAVVYTRERAKADRVAWDAENDRILKRAPRSS